MKRKFNFNIPEFSEIENIDIALKNKSANFPGVYKIFYKERSNYREIYIGETSKQKINDRLKQFLKSAFHGKVGHSGGWRFRNKFSISQNEAASKLFVSFIQIEECEYASVHSKLLERILIKEFFDSEECLPECNGV